MPAAKQHLDQKTVRVHIFQCCCGQFLIEWHSCGHPRASEGPDRWHSKASRTETGSEALWIEAAAVQGSVCLSRALLQLDVRQAVVAKRCTMELDACKSRRSMTWQKREYLSFILLGLLNPLLTARC